MEEIEDGLSPQEFASRIKTKYPEYKDIEDDVLVEKMITKYPEYKGKINFGQPPKGDETKESGESVSALGDTESLSDSKPRKLRLPTPEEEEQLSVPTVTVDGVVKPTHQELLVDKDDAAFRQKFKPSDIAEDETTFSALQDLEEVEKIVGIDMSDSVDELAGQTYFNKSLDANKSNKPFLEGFINETHSKIAEQKTKGEVTSDPNKNYPEYAESTFDDLTVSKIFNEGELSGLNIQEFRDYLVKSGQAKKVETETFDDPEKLSGDSTQEQTFRYELITGYLDNKRNSLLRDKAIYTSRERMLGQDNSEVMAQTNKELLETTTLLMGQLNKFDNLKERQTEALQKEEEWREYLRGDEVNVGKEFEYYGSKAWNSTARIFMGTVGSVSDIAGDIVEGVGDVVLGEDEDDSDYNIFHSAASATDFIYDAISVDMPNLQKAVGDYKEVTKGGVTYQVDPHTNDIYIRGVRASQDEIPEIFRKEILRDAKSIEEVETDVSGRALTSGVVDLATQLYMMVRTAKMLPIKNYTAAAGFTGVLQTHHNNYTDTKRELEHAISTGEIDISIEEADDIAALNAYANDIVIFSAGMLSPNKPLANLDSKSAVGLVKELYKKGASKTGRRKIADFIESNLKESLKEVMQEETEYIFEKNINGLSNLTLGKNILDEEIRKDELVETALVTMLGTSGMTGVKDLTKRNRYGDISNYDIVRQLSKRSSADLQKGIDIAVNDGAITAEEGKKTFDLVFSSIKYDGKIPKSIEGEKRLKLYPLLEKKEELLEKMKNSDDAFKETFKEEIDKVNADIVKTATEKEKVTAVKEDVTEATPQQYATSMSEAIEVMKKEGKGLDLQVDLLTEEDAKKIVDEGGKLFMTKDGKSGAYVKADGYMGGLFKNPESELKNVSKVLQEARLNGFKPVARVKFDESMAPKGWDAETSPLKNKPDLVFFAYDPKSKNKKGEGEYFDTYDEAKKAALGAVGKPDIKPKEGVSNQQIEEGTETPTMDKEIKEVEANQDEIDKDYKEIRQAAKESREQSKGKKEPFLKRVGKSLGKALDEFVDRQGTVKSALDKIGAGRVVDYMVARAGASSSAKFKAEKAYKQIFKGLNNKDIETLEEIIENERVIAIDNNREKRGLEPVKHQGGNNKRKASNVLKKFKQELGDNKYNDLQERAKKYFDTYKEVLKEMQEEGLITQETYDMFAEVNYQPRIFLDFLEDMNEDFLIEELDKSDNIPLSEKQVKAMKGGYEGSRLMDAWYILQKSLLTRSKAKFSNRMNKVFAEEFQKAKEEVSKLRKKDKLTKAEAKKVNAFKNVEDKVKTDKIIGFKENGEPKYAMEKANTRGFSPLYYYVDGVKQRVWMEDKMFDKFTDTNNQYLNSNVRENVALVSGTSLVKTFATGNNPFFFITNTPRDFLFTLTFSKEYGNEIISNSIKLAIDAVKGVRDVISGNKNYQKYLEYGGGMDFLSLQGKYKNKGWTKSMVDGVMNQKTQNFFTRNVVRRAIAKFNLASEVGIRMAVFNKSISNQLKDLGVKDIKTLPKSTQTDIYTKAVRSARELTDFNQGGKTTKALDAALPYLNAAVQGTRAATSNLKKRPLETMVRMTQVVAYTTGSAVYWSLSLISNMRDDEDEETQGMSNSEIYFETLRGVSKYDLENYFIIPKGIKDKEGKWLYYRIAKSQALTPAINASEYYLRKRLAENSGVDYAQDIGEIMFNTVNNNILPISVNPLDASTRIPMVDATFAWHGIDSYTGNPLSWDRGKIPAKLEGIVDPRVEPLFKEIGDMVGVSPVRLQNAVESYITTPSTNPYVGGMYALGNLSTSDKTSDEIIGNLSGDLKKSLTGRFVKSTSEYNEISKLKESVSKEVVESYEKHIRLEKGVRDIVRKVKLGADKDEMKKEIIKLAKENPLEEKRIESWIKSEVKKEKLNPLVSSLRFERNKEVKALILAEKFGDSFLDIKKMSDNEKKIIKELLKKKVIDKEVVNYYKVMMSK
jgi:hypothetical protein